MVYCIQQYLQDNNNVTTEKVPEGKYVHITNNYNNNGMGILQQTLISEMVPVKMSTLLDWITNCSESGDNKMALGFGGHSCLLDILIVRTIGVNIYALLGI